MKLYNMHLASNTLLALLAFGSSAILHAQSLEITDTVWDTKGSTATITGSGSASNVKTWNIGPVGVFEINGGDIFMQVSATARTGNTFLTTKPSLMVARTVDSQGLKDTGTLSVYIRPDPTTTSTAWTLDLNFSFFSDSILANPATITNFQITSLDIDHNQRYYVSDDTFDSSFTYDDDGPSNILPAPLISGFTGFTAAPDSTADDAKSAVSSVGTGHSFDIKLSHTAVALYMLEFRNPSQVVPEPTTALLATAGMALFGFVRRRPQVG